MIKRIAALSFIFICTSIAWMILGTTIVSRTDSPQSSELKSRVAASWGTAQKQSPPIAIYQNVPLPLEASKIDVTLALSHRQKGLLWYSTYGVNFNGDYTFMNPTSVDQDVTFRLVFPATQATYDDLVMTVNDEPLAVQSTNNGAVGIARVGAGKAAVLHTGYRSQGLDTWNYHLGDGIFQVHNFTLSMHTNFKDIDFPENTISPTIKKETPNGWDLTWDYKNLVAGYDIGMTMPEKLQPGPIAGEISYFAPVSLFFFFL